VALAETPHGGRGLREEAEGLPQVTLDVVEHAEDLVPLAPPPCFRPPPPHLRVQRGAHPLLQRSHLLSGVRPLLKEPLQPTRLHGLRPRARVVDREDVPGRVGIEAVCRRAPLDDLAKGQPLQGPWLVPAARPRGRQELRQGARREQVGRGGSRSPALVVDVGCLGGGTGRGRATHGRSVGGRAALRGRLGQLLRLRGKLGAVLPSRCCCVRPPGNIGRGQVSSRVSYGNIRAGGNTRGRRRDNQWLGTRGRLCRHRRDLEQQAALDPPAGPSLLALPGPLLLLLLGEGPVGAGQPLADRQPQGPDGVAPRRGARAAAEGPGQRQRGGGALQGRVEPLWLQCAPAEPTRGGLGRSALGPQGVPTLHQHYVEVRGVLEGRLAAPAHRHREYRPPRSPLGCLVLRHLQPRRHLGPKGLTLRVVRGSQSDDEPDLPSRQKSETLRVCHANMEVNRGGPFLHRCLGSRSRRSARRC